MRNIEVEDFLQGLKDLDLEFAREDVYRFVWYADEKGERGLHEMELKDFIRRNCRKSEREISRELLQSLGRQIQAKAQDWQ